MSFFKRLFIFILILFGMILFGGLLPVVAQSRPVSAPCSLSALGAHYTVSCAVYDSFQPLPTNDSKVFPNISTNSADFDKASRKTCGQAWNL